MLVGVGAGLTGHGAWTSRCTCTARRTPTAQSHDTYQCTNCTRTIRSPRQARQLAHALAAAAAADEAEQMDRYEIGPPDEYHERGEEL